jgi:hypothetical protein
VARRNIAPPSAVVARPASSRGFDAAPEFVCRRARAHSAGRRPAVLERLPVPLNCQGRRRDLSHPNSRRRGGFRIRPTLPLPEAVEKTTHSPGASRGCGTPPCEALRVRALSSKEPSYRRSNGASVQRSPDGRFRRLYPTASPQGSSAPAKRSVCVPGGRAHAVDDASGDHRRGIEGGQLKIFLFAEVHRD